LAERSTRTQSPERAKKLSSWLQDGRFGPFGGRYVPEPLVPALVELENAYLLARDDLSFQQELRRYQTDYCGRPTALYFARRLTDWCGGARIYLKREDLVHGGSHKLNHALGQALLAKRMGKTRLIAETASGQHGVATAMAAAALGLPAEIYMGEADLQHYSKSVYHMKLLGARIQAVTGDMAGVRDALQEALRDWCTNTRTTQYVIGSTVGPHPYPMIVRDFQRVIGDELKGQILRKERRLPDLIVACVGGGSNAIGTFHAFIDDDWVKLLGVEAAGSTRTPTTVHVQSRVGVLYGAKSHVLQDEWGQVKAKQSIAPELSWPMAGPEHALYRETGRVEYTRVTDEQALEAFRRLSQLEGIVPALESAHAVHAALERAKLLGRDALIVVTLSGRGDKDLQTVLENYEPHSKPL
jgi:tryptophan synthase beta chain